LKQKSEILGTAEIILLLKFTFGDFWDLFSVLLEMTIQLLTFVWKLQ